MFPKPDTNRGLEIWEVTLDKDRNIDIIFITIHIKRLLHIHCENRQLTISESPRSLKADERVWTNRLSRKLAEDTIGFELQIARNVLGINELKAFKAS